MKPTLLIADDSPQKIGMLRNFLEKAKWAGEILVAQTTEEAIQLIDGGDVGFAFIDYYIPSSNGPSIIAHLKKKNPAARIALVSSSNNKNNFNEAKEAGAEICICTSDPADEVEETMIEILRSWQSL